MIKIKCSYVGGVTATPNDLIDKHLKLAPTASFKVLLFILRNPDAVEDEKQISRCTGLSEDDVAHCLMFWQNQGVIEFSNEAVSQEDIQKTYGNLKSQSREPVDREGGMQDAPRKITVKSLPVKKPTQREIAKRITEDENLPLIYGEAQNILGTFGYDTQALILMIYDFYGFPPEVIITLLQYQKNEGKTSSAAIKSRAEDWAKRGIDSLETCESELLALEKINAYFDSLKDLQGFSVLTPRISKFLRAWCWDWNCSIDLVKTALEETGYVLTDANKTLKKWANSGIKTPEDVEKRKKKALPKDIQKSYDTETVGKNSVLDWMKRYQEDS